MIKLNIRGELMDGYYRVSISNGHKKIHSLEQLQDILQKCNFETPGHFRITEWLCEPSIRSAFEVWGSSGITFMNKHTKINGCLVITPDRSSGYLRYRIPPSSYAILNNLKTLDDIRLGLSTIDVPIKRFKLTIGVERKLVNWEIILTFTVIFAVALLAYFK